MADDGHGDACVHQHRQRTNRALAEARTSYRRLRIARVAVLVQLVALAVTLWLAPLPPLLVGVQTAVVVGLASSMIITTRLAYQVGFDMHLNDELARTTGDWRIQGTVPHSGDPVTLSGRLVLTDPADVGRVATFMHIGLDDDE